MEQRKKYIKKIRKIWTMNPRVRIKTSKKTYSRKRTLDVSEEK